MHRKDICIIVAAQGIEKRVIQRFRESIVLSKPKHKVDIIIGDTESDINFCINSNNFEMKNISNNEIFSLIETNC
jgi:hypothetical protein